jgi:hypothetical protein
LNSLTCGALRTNKQNLAAIGNRALNKGRGFARKR